MSVKFYGKAENAANEILDTAESLKEREAVTC